MKACVNISLSIALVVKRVSFSSVRGTPNEWSRSRLSIVRIIFSFTYSRTVMHKMGSCGTKVDTRPRMSENNANYYGVKMHHSEHRSFIQETSEKGKIQIQDHVKKRKECVIAESRFTSGAKNATMTEYPGGVHEWIDYKGSSTICNRVIWKRSMCSGKMLTWSKVTS